MSRPEDHERFSEDLQEVAEVLRERRPELEPLELDRIKLRAMSGARRSRSSQQGGFSMRSRVTTLLTVGFLVVGTGGALAGGGGGLGLGGDDGGSASFDQYRHKCERNDRDRRHCRPECPPHEEFSGSRDGHCNDVAHGADKGKGRRG